MLFASCSIDDQISIEEAFDLNALRSVSFLLRMWRRHVELGEDFIPSALHMTLGYNQRDDFGVLRGGPWDITGELLVPPCERLVRCLVSPFAATMTMCKNLIYTTKNEKKE